jgi:hypothetical protein
MNLIAFHQWLCKETPARADELQARLDLLHRMMPRTFADWPKGRVGVSEALTALEVKGLVRKEGADWVWVSAAKASKPEPQRNLFV